LNRRFTYSLRFGERTQQVLCNIKQETFGAVAPAQLPRANNAIRPMSPGTYSEQGLDVDASRADLKELLQAMEPSTRRCVTQAVRLASSGYVLLEFQRVSSDNIAGYVEANKCVLVIDITSVRKLTGGTPRSHVQTPFFITQEGGGTCLPTHGGVRFF